MGTAISELFDESGMSVQAFADKAGLKYGTAYDIAKGVSKVENIGAGAFVRIAHVFGKTADELLSDIPVEPTFNLSPDERELVDCYRATAEIGKHAVLILARQYAESVPAPKEGDAPSLFISRDMTDDEVDERLREYDAALEEWKAARRAGDE